MALAPIRRISGRAVHVPGEDIDTDRIIPARYLRSVTFDGLGEHLFRDVRYDADGELHGQHPIDRPEHKGAEILISGSNFGCGSSREHAPQAIWRWGFKAVIAGSFAEIFFGNSTTLGMPCLTASDSDLQRLTDAVSADPSLELDIDLEALRVTAGDLSIPVTLEESARQALLEGRWDPIAELLEGSDATDAVAGSLPYMQATS